LLRPACQPLARGATMISERKADFAQHVRIVLPDPWRLKGGSVLLDRRLSASTGFGLDPAVRLTSSERAAIAR